VSPAGAIAAVKRSRESMRDATRLLKRPTADSVEATVPSLEDAIAAIGALADILRSRSEEFDRDEVLAAVEEVRSELERARSLLDSAAAYHAAWARILCSMASTYTPDGSAALPEPAPRISVVG
jgi:hypothetical protein